MSDAQFCCMQSVQTELKCTMEQLPPPPLPLPPPPTVLLVPPQATATHTAVTVNIRILAGSSVRRSGASSNLQADQHARSKGSRSSPL
jgi:hypothetical protein